MVSETKKEFAPNPYNPFTWITGDPKIGRGTWIGAFTLIDGLGGLTIGEGVNVSSGAQILSHSTSKRCVSQRRVDIEKAPTVVGDHVFIGSNAVILMGSTIGHHSVIGAGAVVLENSVIPPYSLVVGVPGRVVRNIKAESEKW
ncbi:MAG: acyltransferase [Deltaproteobacteria bacterium]|nr:acyltransferase [Deltaproteobacteria bacterium]MBI3293263.1 acyltransferase [Deltaproteobacteria bacterium]